MGDWRADAFARVERALVGYFGISLDECVALPHSGMRVPICTLLRDMRAAASPERPFTYPRILELASIEASPEVQQQYAKNHARAYVLALRQLCSVSTSDSLFAEFSTDHEAARGVRFVDLEFV